MRLSEWRAGAPSRDALGTKVVAVVAPVLVALGAEPDPTVWVAWGDDPHIRFTILAPTPAGLVVCHVRLNVPGEGPRASAKLVRWSRVQLGELGIETQGGHRLVSFQVEGQVLRGADAEGDAVAAFAVRLFAGADGRPFADLPEPKRRRAAKLDPGGRAASTSRAAAGLPAKRPAARLTAPSEATGTRTGGS